MGCTCWLNLFGQKFWRSRRRWSYLEPAGQRLLSRIPWLWGLTWSCLSPAQRSCRTLTGNLEWIPVPGSLSWVFFLLSLPHSVQFACVICCCVSLPMNFLSGPNFRLRLDNKYVSYLSLWCLLSSTLLPDLVAFVNILAWRNKSKILELTG